MAKKTETAAPEALPEVSDKEKAKARSWFKKARDCWEKRDYDFAIESFVQGMNFWPEAVEEGHKLLWALAISRQQAGGKKPGMMETMKHPVSGKDFKKSMLNAALLMAKDPTNSGHLDALLKSAGRGGFLDVVKFYAPKVLDNLRKDKKPSTARFKAFRQVLLESAERADGLEDPATAAECYEQAVQAVEYLLARSPGDMALKDEQRDLSGRLTIVKGKYDEADSFRESIRDADAQKLLHDTERAKQGEDTYKALLTAARNEVRANPRQAGKINALVNILLKPERRKEENEAIKLLRAAFKDSDNYSFKSRADDIRLRQLLRQTRALRKRFEESGSDEDKQQYRLAQMEERQAQLTVFRERAKKYSTDLKVKYKLGAALFQNGEYDEAIPVLQAAQNDPRSRGPAQLMIGRAFFEKKNYAESAAVLREALDAHEIASDDVGKRLHYWLGRAHEAGGETDEAKAVYGKLLRMDYDFANGDARERLAALK